MNAFRLVLAVLPLFLFCILLLFRRTTSLIKISFFTLALTIIIAFAFWYSPLTVIAVSMVRGLLVAVDILLIIFGAIFFLEILKSNNVTSSLGFHLNNFSPDIRVQVIMLAWFLENFLEGIAGFGTPSTVVAPLLIVLGISPLNAVIIALLGNSTSVPFGAVGTPIRVGFAGINLDHIAIASSTSIYNFVGILVPVFMIWVLVSPNQNRVKLFFQALPFAIWSGIAFVLPAYLVSLFGIEFPSIIGAIAGLFLVLISSRLGIFTPHPGYSPSPAKPSEIKPLDIRRTVLPYALFIFLLVVMKFSLSGVAIPITAISYSINLFNPGTVFIITTLVVAVYSKIHKRDIVNVLKMATEKSIEPFLVIGAMAAMVQLMNNSGSVLHQLPSITQTISSLFNTRLLPIIAPFIGALGSFVTGSATISNLMFANSINTSSIFLGLDNLKILSLALVGAGAGNMIALSDVLAARTVAGSNDSLRDIILKILPYCLLYLALVALFGWVT